MVTRGDFEGAYVVIVFYPKDFTAVGEDTMNLMADLAADQEFSLELMMISNDSVETHRAWAETREGVRGVGYHHPPGLQCHVPRGHGRGGAGCRGWIGV